MEKTDPLLRISHVRKSFGTLEVLKDISIDVYKGVTALDDVSFEVEEGDFVGIIGATGSGKSTLITHMNGLNKPTSGHIIIDGRDLWAEPEKIREFRFLTGLVFQYPEHQLFENDVLSDVCFGPMNQGLSREEAEVEAKKALQHVGFKEKNFSKSPFELSGGQMQPENGDASMAAKEIAAAQENAGDVTQFCHRERRKERKKAKRKKLFAK